jgi:hypothetical protein
MTDKETAVEQAELVERLERFLQEGRGMIEAAERRGYTRGVLAGRRAERDEIAEAIAAFDGSAVPAAETQGQEIEEFEEFEEAAPQESSPVEAESPSQRPLSKGKRLALEWIMAHPGATGSEAKNVGVYYQTLRELVKDGRLRKEGQYPARFYPASGA